MSSLTRALLILLAISFLQACSEPNQMGLVQSNLSSSVSYSRDVKPILDPRCASCHACYDAPCQLKLSSAEGVSRGGSKDKVYDPTRLAEAALSRLYLDAENVNGWRARGFHSVLSSPVDEQQGKTQFSTLIAMLDLKNKYPLPQNYREIEAPIDDPSVWQCPSDRDEFSNFAEEYPHHGMPYALPALRATEVQVLKSWVASGANNDSDFTLTESEQEWVAQWETFLNQGTPKAQLVARYIYEHLFLGSLYSEKTLPGRFFQLQRSSTPPTEPIKVIATRRPYDAPGVERVYYRLQLRRETVVAKTHMPYRLDDAKHKAWTDWFFKTDYTVTELPGYDIETASNPFKVFAQLPAEARYKLMLSEANFTIKGFIKGPVCKGPSAVNVINDHFWVFFIDPDYQEGEAMNNHLARVTTMLDLPAEKEDTLNLLGAWDEFAEKERAFLKERTQFIQQNLNNDGVFDIELIWDGDGDNPNAALTVFRHFDNASVNTGLIGQTPKTAWVIDYPLLERIHYLLVAGYDVYGNISHQLLSRIYMDFLRMEGESMFLTFLPQQEREEIRQHWYREADERIEQFMALTDVDTQSDSIVPASATRPKLALYKKFTEHIGAALSNQYQLSEHEEEEVIDNISRLQRDASEGFMHLPEVTFLEVYSPDERRYYTIIRNTGHLNNTSVLFEQAYIEEDETTVSVVPGFIGPRPNALMRVPSSEFSSFSSTVLKLASDEDYTQLMDNYGVRRTNPKFWSHYDDFVDGFKQFSRVDYGLLDLNKLENR